MCDGYSQRKVKYFALSGLSKYCKVLNGAASKYIKIWIFITIGLYLLSLNKIIVYALPMKFYLTYELVFLTFVT